MKSKLFSLFLALVASTGIVLADYDIQVGDLYYDIDYPNRTAVVIYKSASINYQGKYEYNDSWNIQIADIPSTIPYAGTELNVIGIGDNAFNGCQKLSSVIIPSSVISIGDNAFKGCPISSFEVADGGTTYSSQNGVLFNHDKTCLLIYPLKNTATSYTIPTGVQRIKDAAFSSCVSLTNITMPNSINIIGSSAFSGCTNLTTINIPDNIKRIPQKAFAGCRKLTSIGTPQSISSIGEEAFSGCTSLVSISFTDSLSQIENKAFQNCKNLESIYLGNSLRILYPYAFWNCSSLNSIVLPNTLYFIDEHVFDGCTNLLSINIPSGLQGFRKDQYKTDYCSVFANCTNLKTVAINSNAIIGTDYTSTYNLSNIFGQQVEKYIIGENVNKVGDFAFYNCENLTSVILQGQMYSWILDEDAYLEDEQGDYILMNAGDEISYWTGVKTIGNNAFSRCSNIQSIKIPDRTTKIGYNAFSGCTNLDTLVLGNKVSDIGNDAFWGCSFSSINIPSSVKTIGQEAFNYCKNLSKVEINDIASYANIDFADSISNPLFFAKHLYHNDEEIIDLVIPDSVTVIKKYAFINGESLQSVSIPYSVEEFNINAFSGCKKITSVTINSDAVIGRDYQEKRNMSHVFGEQVKEYIIGDSVSTIGAYAFYQCDSIDSFVFGKNVTEIGSRAFYSAGKFSRRLHPIYEDFVLPAKLTRIGAYAFFCWFGLTSLTLPDSMQYIGQAAFGGCRNLAYLSIPASLNSISGEAFFGCTGLKSVTCWATTPPIMQGSDDNVNYHTVFTSVDCDKVPLFVPKESIEEYKTAYQWEEFTHIVTDRKAESMASRLMNTKAIAWQEKHSRS